MTVEERLKRILEATEAQAKDTTLWLKPETAGERYVMQSLRYLHYVIEETNTPVGEMYYQKIVGQQLNRD